MPVSDQVALATRALLLGNDQETVAITSGLGDAEMSAYDALLQAVLSLAAGQRFASGYTDGDVIRYVARVRAGTAVRAQDLDLDPTATEAVLRGSLGQPTPAVSDSQTRMRAILALLTTVMSELELNEPDIGSLLAKARALADGWLVQSAARDGGCGT